MKLYLAGPMQGIPQFNFPLFNRVAAQLRADGHEVFNPAERDIARHGGVDISIGNENGDLKTAVDTHAFSLEDALADDTHYICKEAKGIVLLPGWEYSSGALAEWALARALKHQFAYVQIGVQELDIEVPFITEKK